MQVNSIRNPEGFWINSNVFREEAIHHEKYGYYCPDPWGSPAWIDYWQTQLDRCIWGYTVGGVEVTGDHYFYMNFCKIEKVKVLSAKVAIKKEEFPDFWDGDYNYYWSLRIARDGLYKTVPNIIPGEPDVEIPDLERLDGLQLSLRPHPDYLTGGNNMIIGKARRKGYSYKNAAICVNTYNSIKNSLTLIGAFEKKSLYPEGTMGMASNYMEFLNKETGWTKAREYVNKVDHKRASFQKIIGGIPIESGYKSDIMALTFMDNPDAARGKDPRWVLFEEAGAFPNLEASYTATRPGLRAGKFATGMALIFGCVCAGTKVYTNEGKLVNIEDLKQEEGILGYNNQSATQEEITYLKPPAKKPCYKITTDTGRELECSDDHPILWSSQNHVYSKRKYDNNNERVYLGMSKKATWKETKDIKQGDHIAVINSVPYFGTKKMWEPRLVGILIGDGSYGKDKTPVLSNCEPEILNYVESNYETTTEKQYLTQTGKQYKELRIRNICPKLRELGIYGQSKDKKTLPNNLHEYNKASLANLIGGLFDSDGYIKIKKGKYETMQIIFTSAYLNLTKEIKELCHRFGIHGSIQYIKPSIRKDDRAINDVNGYYRLVIADVDSVFNFYKNIRLVTTEKQRRLEQIVELNNRSKSAKSTVMVKTSEVHKSYVDLTDVEGIRFEIVKSIEYIGEKDVYNLTAGTTHTYIANGIITHNTGGDMEKGTADFARMFYNPKGYGLMPFINIWDENAENTACGFFHPFFLNNEGYMDNQGNSNSKSAIKDELEIRQEIIKESSGSSILQGRVQEYPMNPSEAFLTVSFNDFPIIELRNRLNKVVRENLHLKMGQPVEVYRDDTNKARYKPDLNNKLQPIWDYEPKIKDLSGAVVMYEAPIENPPKGLYKIGFDPYRQVKGESLAAIYVYKGRMKFSYTRDTIVATFIGRPKDPDDVNRICELLCEIYHAEVMHENEVTHVKNYFERRKKLHLLASQPDAVISSVIKASRVARIYGIHMVEKLKDAGEKYIKRWLLEERDVDGNGTMLTNIDTISDPGFLEELILYNRKGNFDRCLVKDTKITTLTGLKNIQDICIGDYVLTSNGQYEKVTNKCKNNYKDELYELDIVGQANTLETTNNHPILIASTKTKKHNTRLNSLNNIEYKRADELNNKYQFTLLPKRQNLPQNNYSDDLLYLTGWMLGDGTVNKKSNVISICLQHNQEDIADKLMSLIDKFTETEKLTTPRVGIRNSKEFISTRQYKNTPTQKYKKDGYIKIVKTSKRLTDFFLKQGCEPNNKKISKELYNTANLMPLAIGLLEADGHQSFSSIGKYQRCNIGISTIYKDLLLQLRQILLDNGIWSSISNVIKEDQKDQLRLHIPTNYINKTLSYYPSFKYKNTNITCQKYIQIETEIGFWTPIKIKNREYQEVEVYNIEVENTNTYLANGVVNHNCMAFMMVMFQCEEEDLGKEYVPEDKNDEEEINRFIQSLYNRAAA